MTPYPGTVPKTSSVWRRMLDALTTDDARLDAEQEQRAAERLGGTLVADLPARAPATVCGTLRAVTLRPRGGVMALEAELSDGSGVVALVWLGRRQIAGVDPGRRMKACGLVSSDGGRRVIFNPRYELLPPGAA